MDVKYKTGNIEYKTLQTTIADYLGIDRQIVSKDYKLPEDKLRRMMIEVEVKCDTEIPDDMVKELDTPGKIQKFMERNYWTYP